MLLLPAPSKRDFARYRQRRPQGSASRKYRTRGEHEIIGPTLLSAENSLIIRFNSLFGGNNSLLR